MAVGGIKGFAFRAGASNTNAGIGQEIAEGVGSDATLRRHDEAVGNQLICSADV
jgi:hypothetical protein